MYCHHGHFSSEKFTRVRGSVTGPPDHIFTQEIEMGLPYRFGVATEAKFERFNGGGGAETVSLEARWALAKWNKIPLNPTLFAEYKFGVGTIRHEEGPPPPPGEKEEEEGGPPKVPDAYEFRLLLAQDFGEQVEWAMNFFFEKENTGDRGREWGFSQSAMMPILLPNERLKVGVEMEYKNFTVKDTRGDPMHTFTIGPTVAWKSTPQTRLDVSPCSGAPTTRQWLMSLPSSPGSSAANAPKPKHPSPRGSVTIAALAAPIAIREKKSREKK
jgi:hypothetical protein